MSAPYFIKPVNLSDATQIDNKLEHRKVYTLNNLELNIYETFINSHQVRLSYDGLVITSMMRGRKIIHHEEERTSFNFLPGTSIIVPEGIQLKAEFPDADEKNPVQCATLTLNWDKVYETIDYVNYMYPKEDGTEWKLDFSHYHFKNNRNLALTLNRLISLSMEECEGKDALADLLLKSLLIRVMQTQQIPLINPKVEKPDSIKKIEEYVYNNITKEISIDDLSQVASCSRSSLYRVIKEHYKLSPTDFIQNIRVRYAKGILMQPDKNVSDACFQSGFNSLSYFSKIFKKTTGQTPTEYLQELKDI